MDRVLLVTAGSLGDILPVTAMARALHRRGIEPVVLANPGARPVVESAGFACLTAGHDFEIAPLLRRRPAYMGLRGGVLVLKELFIPAARDFYSSAESAIEHYNLKLVVTHPGCFGAVWAAWRLGVPVIPFHLAPLSLMLGGDFRIYPRPRRWLARGLLPLVEAQANRWLRPEAEGLGVAWDAGLLRRTMQGNGTILGLWSPLFRTPGGDDPTGLITCGFPLPPEPPPLGEPLERFLFEGPAPLAVSLGSTAVHVAGAILKRIPELCGRLGLRAVVTGVEPNGAARRSGAVLYTGPESFERLFARSAAIIHHGGIGTTAAAMRSGIPSLALPFGHDQFDNGLRLKRLGAGERLWQRRATTGTMARRLTSVLSDETHRGARALAARLAKEPDGAETAADGIAGVIAGR